MENAPLHIIITGHVDHGKSTLIGRLFYDTGCLPPDKVEEIKKISGDMGKEMEFAYMMDHLEEERRKGITIDIAHTFFRTQKRGYVIIDAPGHKEFLKNMITGSSQAEAALLLVDAVDGIQDQTKRHSFILSMLGVRQAAVLVNKMDMVQYSKERFDAITHEITRLLNQFQIRPSYIIPISARYGSNIVNRDDRLKWFEGPTVLEALDRFETLEMWVKPLRFPVQDVYDINGKKIVVGRIEAGQVRKGEELTILPGGEKATVLSIEKFQEEGIEMAYVGECIGIYVDKPIVRGEVLIRSQKLEVRSQNLEPRITQNIHANIFWMGNNTYCKGEPFTFKCATQEVEGEIRNIYKRFDPATIEVMEKDAAEIRVAEIAEVEIFLEKPVVVDPFPEIPEMGRFTIEKKGHPVAGGIII